MLTENSFISIGISYSIKKSEKSVKTSIGTITQSNEKKLDSQWIEIPLLYNHNFNKLTIYGGTYINFLIDEETKETTSSNGVKQSITKTETYENFDYGLKIGGTYKTTNAGAIYVDLSLGLSDIVKIESSDSQLYTFSFGYSHIL